MSEGVCTEFDGNLYLRGAAKEVTMTMSLREASSFLYKKNPNFNLGIFRTQGGVSIF